MFQIQKKRVLVPGTFKYVQVRGTSYVGLGLGFLHMYYCGCASESERIARRRQAPALESTERPPPRESLVFAQRCNYGVIPPYSQCAWCLDFAQKEMFLLGRSAPSSIRPASRQRISLASDSEVSSEHCVLFQDQGRFFVRDPHKTKF